jgi:hypothetical protein
MTTRNIIALIVTLYFALYGIYRWHFQAVIKYIYWRQRMAMESRGGEE